MIDLNDFFTKVLTGLKLPVTETNLSFFREWANHEKRSAGKPHGFNPLNTSFNLTSDSGMTTFNSHNVRNYSTLNNGVTATIKTLNLGYYKPIREALAQGYADRQDIYNHPGVSKAFKTWGTVTLAAKATKTKEDNSDIIGIVIIFALILFLTL